MKILRILLIILVPAMGIVSCKKSELKPSATQETNANSAVTPQSNSANRIIDNTEVNSNPNGGTGTDIYGSGDDDRDGGDKKNKKAAAK